MREAMNLVEAGEMVVITRHKTDFVLTTAKHWNDKQVQAQRGFATLVTDDTSSDIRPEISHLDSRGMEHSKNIEVDTSGHIRPRVGYPAGKIASEPQAAEDWKDSKGDNFAAGEWSCCQNKTPCKHWYFNDTMQEWVNNLSGRVRQVEA